MGPWEHPAPLEPSDHAGGVAPDGVSERNDVGLRDGWRQLWLGGKQPAARTFIGLDLDGASSREQRQLVFGAVGVMLAALIALAGLILGLG